jgi:hypothetical protein
VEKYQILNSEKRTHWHLIQWAGKDQILLLEKLKLNESGVCEEQRKREEKARESERLCKLDLTAEIIIS